MQVQCASQEDHSKPPVSPALFMDADIPMSDNPTHCLGLELHACADRTNA